MSSEINWSWATDSDNEEIHGFRCTNSAAPAPRWQVVVEDFLTLTPVDADKLLVGRDSLGIAALVRWNAESLEFPLLRAYAVAWRRQGERPSVARQALSQMLVSIHADAQFAGLPAIFVEARIDVDNDRSRWACLNAGFVQHGLVESGVERWMYRART
ncbi:hypothetical protein OG218_26420 [Kineococcus sp. NBC_00420]|uniref:hypothetical protein n=1 Tax=Kineococcus sp. NBC_00420 TaxID=2903564 RepID=UPI002E1D2EC6